MFFIIVALDPLSGDILTSTDDLSMKLHKALTHEVDDYLDARIKFLRHQVQLQCTHN